MGSAWFIVRADLRRRWRAMLAVVLLIGLVSGVVLVAAAGARRTGTAYPRMLRWANATQLRLVPGLRWLRDGRDQQARFVCRIRCHSSGFRTRITRPSVGN